MKSSLLRLPNEIIVIIFRTLESEYPTNISAAARVCLALTSKRVAGLAMQTRINLPDRWLFDEKTFRHAQPQMAQAQHTMHYFIDLRPGRPVSNSVSQVQPEHYMTVTMLHELMFALREWMPESLLYCCILWHLEDAVKRTRRKYSAFYFRSASSEAANDRSKAVCLSHLSYEGSKQIALA